MYFLRGIGFGSALSSVLGKLSLTGSLSDVGSDAQMNSDISGNNLRFHSVHGKAIILQNDSSLAIRDNRYFEHSILFSHRPVSIDEMISIEITEITRDFHGPLRIGFTTCDPSVFQNEVVPLGRDLKNVQGIWLKSLQLYPMNEGTTIFFKLESDGIVLYGVDGEFGGILFKDVDTSQSLWVILEAYGSVQALKFVNKTMDLVKDDHNEVPEHPSPNYARYARRTVMCSPAASLNTRRNVRLAPLQNFTSSGSSPRPAMTPGCKTPAFFSPAPFDQFSPGLCIICTERDRNAAFTKCGHLCMCFECAETFQNHSAPTPEQPRPRRARKPKNLCPICRQPIASVLKIYI